MNRKGVLNRNVNHLAKREKFDISPFAAAAAHLSCLLNAVEPFSSRGICKTKQQQQKKKNSSQ